MFARTCLLLLACTIAVCAQQDQALSPDMALDEVVPEQLLHDESQVEELVQNTDVQAIQSLKAYSEVAIDKATDMKQNQRNALCELVIALGTHQSVRKPSEEDKAEAHAAAAAHVAAQLTDKETKVLTTWKGDLLQDGDSEGSKATKPKLWATSSHYFHEAMEKVGKKFSTGLGHYLLKAVDEAVNKGIDVIAPVPKDVSEGPRRMVGFTPKPLGLDSRPAYFVKLSVPSTMYSDRLSKVMASDEQAVKQEKAAVKVAEKAEKAEKAAVKVAEKAEKAAEEKAKATKKEKDEKKAEKAKLAEEKAEKAEKARKKAEEAAAKAAARAAARAAAKAAAERNTKEVASKAPVYSNSCKKTCTVSAYSDYSFKGAMVSHKSFQSNTAGWKPSGRHNTYSVKLSSGCQSVKVRDDDDHQSSKGSQDKMYYSSKATLPYDLRADVEAYDITVKTYRCCVKNC